MIGRVGMERMLPSQHRKDDSCHDEAPAPIMVTAVGCRCWSSQLTVLVSGISSGLDCRLSVKLLYLSRLVRLRLLR